MSPFPGEKIANYARPIAQTIFAWTLSCASACLDLVAESTGQDNLTGSHQKALLFEIMSFFLTMFEHYSLSVCRKEPFLESFLDETIRGVILLISGEMGSDFEGSEILTDEIYDYYESAAADYRKCRFIMKDEPDYEGTTTVIGRLSARISAIFGLESLDETGIAASSIAVESLAESGLKNQIKKACDALG